MQIIYKMSIIKIITKWSEKFAIVQMKKCGALYKNICIEEISDQSI